jgi:hypothetical protein
MSSASNRMRRQSETGGHCRHGGSYAVLPLASSESQRVLHHFDRTAATPSRAVQFLRWVRTSARGHVSIAGVLLLLGEVLGSSILGYLDDTRSVASVLGTVLVFDLGIIVGALAVLCVVTLLSLKRRNAGR